MADDSNEDKQVKNDLSAIKAQVTATNNPAELARLASAAAGLASSTNNPEILDQIKNIQSAISKKEENAEQIIYSDVAAENFEAREQQHDPEVVREQELHERHESLKASHDKFMQDADGLIEKKKKHNENLEGILDDLKNGREIDPERLKSAVKTEEQVREEREMEKALRERQQLNTQHYQELQAEEERLQKQKAGYVKEAEEQHKINETLPSNELQQGQQKLSGIVAKIEQTDVKLAAIRPKLEEAKKMKADSDKQVEESEKQNKIRETTKEKIKEEIDKHKEKNPEIYNQKYSQLDDFYSLIEGQNETHKTGEIKDNELHNKFLGKENQAEILAKAPEEIPVKSLPEILPIAPDIKREAIPTQAQSKEENIFEKITRNFGDKIVELKEKYGFKIPKEEVTNAQKEVRNGLENQNTLPTKNKETEVSKQLNRTNQQNKKNEGHTR